MPNFKNKLSFLKGAHLAVFGALFMILLAVFLIWFNHTHSIQAVPASASTVYFVGEYRIGDGPWQTIVKGEHIPATKGDVTLRGDFHITTPDGVYRGVYKRDFPIAFYTNHIGLTFYENGVKVRVIDNEHPMIGVSACGESWTSHSFSKESTAPVEIVIHNSHLFGNETAVDELLSSIAIYGGIDFEKGVLESGETQRYVGILFIIVALVFLGTALFSTLIHIKNSKIIWLIGALVMFAGVYFTYSSDGVSYWSDSVISNTTMLGCSMIMYMLFLLMGIVYFLKRTKRVGLITVTALAVIDAVLFILPTVSGVYFYDTWGIWVIVQAVANAAMIYCLIHEFVVTKRSARWIYAGALLPLVAFACDAIGSNSGAWRGGVVSLYVFIGLFAAATIVVLQLIPQNINATTKAKELEMEKIVLNAQLAESRISTMMSQIRPHFIYNTLGSIEQLCKLDPPKAGELVHNFAKYLRGNFGELDNPKPILMSQEMEHVRHYISIENVRFPDMTFHFEMNSDDFRIPALTIQPIVENAIKHGLMKLQKGGTIHVFSYETDKDYFISVVDDGAGFDTSALLDDRKHVGLRNIRERLKVMVGGTLEIESTVGVGTKVLIRIPKEDRV